jgi:hypothetical protein
MNGVTVETIVNLICESLQIKKIQLAKMIGINESSISSNLSKTIDEVAGKKTGKRLLPLALIILSLPKGIYSPVALTEGLNQPTISNPLGFKESIMSAIQSGRDIDALTLVEKAKEGINIYTAKKEALNKEIFTEVQKVLYA